MGSDVTLRVLDIVPGTSVDGPGLRTSIYFAGCSHHCPGCHNPESWDPHGGREMTVGQIMEIIRENEFNVTFSGGDPIFQLNGITELSREIKKVGLTIWVYTGFRYEDLCKIDNIDLLLENVEAVVDGPYIESKRDITLRFRGSSNQRIIYVHNE